MARTWSYAKKVETTSAAARARSRPSGLTAFVVLMTLAVIFFLGLTFYSAAIAVIHPPSEVAQPDSQ